MRKREHIRLNKLPFHDEFASGEAIRRGGDENVVLITNFEALAGEREREGNGGGRGGGKVSLWIIML